VGRGPWSAGHFNPEWRDPTGSHPVVRRDVLHYRLQLQGRRMTDGHGCHDNWRRVQHEPAVLHIIWLQERFFAMLIKLRKIICETYWLTSARNDGWKVFAGVH
jgi:hypothetical protein